MAPLSNRRLLPGTTPEKDYRLQQGWAKSDDQNGPNQTSGNSYDYDGRRILKIGAEGRRHYTYDQLSVITEADETNATVSKYDYGLDQLVSLNNGNEGRSFFHLDILDSAVTLTTQEGSVRESIIYDAWGIERDRIGSSANRFTYTGQEVDRETGLHYFKARFYDPDIGRFISQDSVFGNVADPPSLHRYSYVQQNPFFFVDPTGNIPFLQRIREKLRSATEGVLEQGIQAAESIEDDSLLGGAAQRFVARQTGRAAGVIGAAEGLLGLVNFGANLAVGLATPLAPDSELIQETAEEVTQTFDELSNTARIVKEVGIGTTALQIAKSGTDKLAAAAKGDVRAIAEVEAFATEVAVEVVAGSKGTKALTKVPTRLARATKEIATRGQRRALRETARFLREEGITDPALRRQIIKAGLRETAGPETPATLIRFQQIFTGTLQRGKQFRGRLGNIETRVATIKEALKIERRGLTPFFERRAGRRFVDILATDPTTGQPVDVLQLVKVTRRGVIAGREIPAAQDIAVELGQTVRFVVTGSTR